MTEDEARDYCAQHFTPAQRNRLERFAALLLTENAQQNLISPATCAIVWSRHIVDSAQLLRFVPPTTHRLADIGSGPGLPGLVFAMLADITVTLIEPRTRRVDFLRQAAADLELTNVHIERAKAEQANGSYDVISARAVATIPKIITMTQHLRHARSRLVLPRGSGGRSEIDDLSPQLARMFHVEQSVTDDRSVIVIAEGV